MVRQYRTSVKPGEKYNKLTVLRYTHSYRNSQKKFDCICECGNIVNVVGTKVKNGRVKSCGCLRKENVITKLYRPKLEIRNNERYGRLVVLRFVDKDKHGHYVYECKCDCGNITTVRGSNLVMGRTQSCGCGMSRLVCGEKHHNWKGGISYEPYCVLFNDEFKLRVRQFFGNTCVECGKTREEEGINMCVHHVNFDKETCCNDTKPLFVTLCKSCHSKTNFDREYWEEKYTRLINEEYNGQCYMPKQ